MSAWDLSAHFVSSSPPSSYYVPDFINEAEETALLENVYNSPKPKWIQLSNRRLQNWGGLPHPKGMVAEKIPDWLNKYLIKLGGLDIFDGKQVIQFCRFDLSSHYHNYSPVANCRHPPIHFGPTEGHGPIRSPLSAWVYVWITPIPRKLNLHTILLDFWHEGRGP